MKKLFTILALAASVTAMAQTTVKWSGAVSGDWDYASANWLPTVGLPFPTTFAEGNHAIIDNTSLEGADTLKVIGNITTGNINVNNDAAHTYMILTDGVATSKLTGTGTLIKEGVGELRMRVLNELTGGTIARGGTITQWDITDPNCFGPKIVFEGGAVKGAYRSTGTYVVTASEMEVAAGKTGTFITNRYHNWDSKLTGAGTLNVVANGERFFIRTHLANMNEFTGTINVIKDGNPYSAGYNAFAFDARSGKTWNPEDPSTAENHLANAKVHLGTGTTLMSHSGTRCFEIGELTAEDETVTVFGYYTSSTSPIIYWQLGGLNTDVTFPGYFRPQATATDGKPRRDNKVGIIKVGTGVLKLTNPKNYITSSIEVKGGKVFISNPEGTESGTGYQGNYGTMVFVRQNGALGGTGRISGHIDVEGKLEPGENGIGTLTIGDSLSLAALETRRKFDIILRSTATTEMEVSSAILHDKLVADSIQYNGKLVVKLAAAYDLKENDVIQLFAGATSSKSATFSTIELPMTDQGWEWDTSTLYVDGSIKLTKGGGTVVGVKPNIDKYISVYPNPSKGNFKVEVAGGKGVNVEVYNASGAMVASKPFTGNDVAVNLGALKGVFVVKITTTEGTVVRKVVVR